MSNIKNQKWGKAVHCDQCEEYVRDFKGWSLADIEEWGIRPWENHYELCDACWEANLEEEVVPDPREIVEGLVKDG